MNDELNRKVAEVARWTNITQPAHWIGLTGVNLDGMTQPLPDFLAPENLHLLIELAEKNGLMVMEKEQSGKWSVMLSGPVEKPLIAQYDPSLSKALALAIVEGAA